MTLNKLLNNLETLKIRKVKVDGQTRYRVVDLNCSGRWAYIGEFDTKQEAEDFKWRRAHY